MREKNLKRAILCAIGAKPDFACLKMLHHCGRARKKRVLQWLDHSGIALYLLHRLQSEGVLEQCPLDFREALELRSHKNQERTRDMLDEFRRLNESFAAHGAEYCAVKGFTLLPDFCANPCLRHQADFDFLVEAASVEKATLALHDCGYTFAGSKPDGEITFSTPLMHVPTVSDDIYELPRHRQVEVRPNLWQEKHCVSLAAPADYFKRVQQRNSLGTSFPGLSNEDAFFYQLLHAFQHLLTSWIRCSWLLEIDFFLASHAEDVVLWDAVRKRVGDDGKTRDAVGLILLLTSKLFQRALPVALESWCVAPLSDDIRAWVEQIGVAWVISDFPGSKVTLLVHQNFVNDSRSWREYFIRRLFPMHAWQSPTPDTDAHWRVKAKGRVVYVLSGIARALFHLCELGSLALGALRWRTALYSKSKRTAVTANGSS